MELTPLRLERGFKHFKRTAMNDLEFYEKEKKVFRNGLIKGGVIGTIIGTILLLLLTSCAAYGQVYYSEIPKERFIKIVSGDSFHPAKVLFHDGTQIEGFVARFPDSSIIRFRETMENDCPTKTLTERHVASFMYGLPKYEYPQFVYRDIDLRDKKTKIRPVKIVTKGIITVYVYTWVEYPDAPIDPFANGYTYNSLFYLEKYGALYDMKDFKKDILPLIKDKKEVFVDYKKIKHRKREFSDYINLVIKYNETE